MAYYFEIAKAFTIMDIGLTSTHITGDEEIAIKCHLQHFFLNSLSMDADVLIRNPLEVDPSIICTNPRCQEIIRNETKTYQGWNDDLLLKLKEDEDFTKGLI